MKPSQVSAELRRISSEKNPAKMILAMTKVLVRISAFSFLKKEDVAWFTSADFKNGSPHKESVDIPNDLSPEMLESVILQIMKDEIRELKGKPNNIKRDISGKTVVIWGEWDFAYSEKNEFFLAYGPKAFEIVDKQFKQITQKPASFNTKNP